MPMSKLLKPLPSTKITTVTKLAAMNKHIISPKKTLVPISSLTKNSKTFRMDSNKKSTRAVDSLDQNKFNKKFIVKKTLQHVPFAILKKANMKAINANPCIDPVVEEIDIKSEPEDEADFEEVAIDGTELKTNDSSDGKGSKKVASTIYTCTQCKDNVCFPDARMLEAHVQMTHQKKNQKHLIVKNKSMSVSLVPLIDEAAAKESAAAKQMLAKRSTWSKIVFPGYSKDGNDIYHCNFCPFKSDKRSTTTSHSTRKHTALIAAATRKAANDAASKIDEDDETSWPVDILEDEDNDSSSNIIMLKEEFTAFDDKSVASRKNTHSYDEGFDAFENDDSADALDESKADAKSADASFEPTPAKRAKKKSSDRKPGDAKSNCKYCDYVSCKSSTLHSHVQRKHYEQWLAESGDKILGPQYDELTKCSHCAYRTRSVKNMKSHLARKHAVSVYELVQVKSEPVEGDNNDAAAASKFPSKTKEIVLRGVVEALACPYCQYETYKPVSLRSHVTRKHKGEEMPEAAIGRQRETSSLSHTGYACQYCTFVACTIPSIRAHRHREHAGVKMSHLEIPSDAFDCDVCAHKAGSRRDMQQHIRESHNLLANEDGLFACHSCSFETQSRMGLQRHMSIKHYSKKHDINKQTEYPCELCDFTTYNRKIIEWHRFQHELPLDGNNQLSMNFRCNDCDFATWNKRQLHSHINRKHKDQDGNEATGSEQQQLAAEENKLACEMCDYVAKNKHVLKVHIIRKHTENYAFACELCGRKYKVKADLTNHIRFQHREQPIVCEVCGKTCRNSNLLYLHQKFAHFKPDFECPICRKRVVSQANLDEHILKQHEMNQEVMCEECGKVFRKKSRLKLHMRVHTGAKPYACRICNRSFARRNGYRQHLLIHTGQKMYICDICGKTFTQKTGLICHRKSHPGDHPPLPKISIDHVLNEFFEDNF